VVDDEALIAALKSGRLAAAGLDVFDGEPRIHQGYYGLSNAFLLPHMGSATTETRNAMGFKALDNLETFLLRKQAPPDLVKSFLTERAVLASSAWTRPRGGCRRRIGRASATAVTGTEGAAGAGAFL